MTMKQDAAYLLPRLAEAKTARRVGEKVQSYNGQSVTTITAIEEDIVQLANGDAMHVSKVRSAQVKTTTEGQLRKLRRTKGFIVTPITSTPGLFLVLSRQTSYFVQVVYR